MITITHDAAHALANARAASGASHGCGVRFFVVQTPEQGKALAFDFVEEPEPQDEVAEQQGMPVFIERDLAGVIGDSTLEARETEGRTELVLRSSKAGT